MNEDVSRTIPVEYKDWHLDVSYSSKHHSDASVVCLHGLQSNKEVFSPVVELCASKGFSTVSIDFIGFGESSKPKDFSYELEDQAAIVDQVITELRLRKFFLIGHSMGGMVGTMLLSKWQDHLLGFINMEGNFVLKDCGTSLPVSEASFEEFSQNMYPEIVKKRKEWLQSVPDYVFYKSSQSIVHWSRSEKLLPLFLHSPVKKLFVYGDKNSQKKDIFPPSLQTAEIPNAGHFMFADNPEQTLKIVEEFLLHFSHE